MQQGKVEIDLYADGGPRLVVSTNIGKEAYRSDVGEHGEAIARGEASLAKVVSFALNVERMIPGSVRSRVIYTSVSFVECVDRNGSNPLASLDSMIRDLKLTRATSSSRMVVFAIDSAIRNSAGDTGDLPDELIDLARDLKAVTHVILRMD